MRRLWALLALFALGCAPAACPVCPACPAPHPDPYLARPVSPKGWDDPLYRPECSEGWSCKTARCVAWGLDNGASMDQINAHCAEAPGGQP